MMLYKWGVHVQLIISFQIEIKSVTICKLLMNYNWIDSNHISLNSNQFIFYNNLWCIAKVNYMASIDSSARYILFYWITFSETKKKTKMKVRCSFTCNTTYECKAHSAIIYLHSTSISSRKGKRTNEMSIYI